MSCLRWLGKEKDGRVGCIRLVAAAGALFSDSFEVILAAYKPPDHPKPSLHCPGRPTQPPSEYSGVRKRTDKSRTEW